MNVFEGTSAENVKSQAKRSFVNDFFMFDIGW